jgi:hypothetical protein
MGADKRRPKNGQREAFAQIADEIAEETRFYKMLYERKGIEPTDFALAMARTQQTFYSINYKVKGDPFGPARARALWEKYYNEAQNLGAAIDELPSETDCPFYDLIKLGQLCKDRAQKSAEAEQPTEASGVKTEQNAAPAINIENIENFKGILGDVQAENVQTGNHASIHKQTVTAEKKKGILKKLLKWLVGIIGAIIVSIIADILGHFGWFERIKTIVHNILTNK